MQTLVNNKKRVLSSTRFFNVNIKGEKDLEQVIEIYYPQTKERRIKTVKQNQNKDRWAVSQKELNKWEEQRKRGERAHEIRLAEKLINETLRDLRRA